MKIEQRTRGGRVLRIVQVKAKLKTSKNPEVIIAQVPGVPDTVEAPTFYLSPSDVGSTKEALNGTFVDGTINAVLRGEPTSGSVPVYIPGDAVSYGPNLSIPESLVV